MVHLTQYIYSSNLVKDPSRFLVSPRLSKNLCYSWKIAKPELKTKQRVISLLQLNVSWMLWRLYSRMFLSDLEHLWKIVLHRTPSIIHPSSQVTWHLGLGFPILWTFTQGVNRGSVKLFLDESYTDIYPYSSVEWVERVCSSTLDHWVSSKTRILSILNAHSTVS